MLHDQTPYHRRVQARLAKARNMRATTKLTRYEKVDHFMLTYEQAYFTYYRVRVTVSYRHGWYYIGQCKYRHSDLEIMTNRLLAKLQEEDAPPPGEEDGVCE